jgi:hypothetical protein
MFSHQLALEFNGLLQQVAVVVVIIQTPFVMVL